MQRPATLTAQLNKPCISWLPNLKSTSCQCFPDNSQLLQDSSHASSACLCTVHFPPAGHRAVQLGGCSGYNASSWSPLSPKKLTTFPLLPSSLWWGTPTGSCHFDRRHQWSTFPDWHLWQRSHSSFHCLAHLWWELLNSHILRVLPTQALLAAGWNSNSETE